MRRIFVLEGAGVVSFIRVAFRLVAAQHLPLNLVMVGLRPLPGDLLSRQLRPITIAS